MILLEEELLDENKKWYCPLPFRHVFVDSTGVSACCNTPRYPVSIPQWEQHPALKKLQQQTLSGEIPEICQPCVTQEAIQGRSLRTDSNRDYNYSIATETCIDFVDYRSSNICNFKCRSCTPLFSHGIAQETRSHKILSQFYGTMGHDINKTISVTDTNHQWIIENLSQIKRLMFTGGEPTVIPEIKKIIQEITKNHRHIQLIITSNASFTDKFWFDITQQIENLHWTISLDAVGEAAEIVRHGTDWQTVSQNIEWLSKNANSLDINTVVSNLNTLQIGPLLTFVRNMQKISTMPTGKQGDVGCRHQFYVCQRPYHLCADNWPPDLQPIVIDYLNQCTVLDLDQEQSNLITGLIQQIKIAKFDLNLWEQGLKFNQKLDQIRQQDSTILFHPKLL
jgi:organic radical activating enzyme